MSDFTLFENMLNSVAKMEITPEKPDCMHQNLTDEGGLVSCLDCGSELEKSIYHDKEWRYYGQSDNKKSSDPNRVTLRKVEDKNIYKDVENMGFSDKIVSSANQLYLHVSNGKIFRGSSRKAIIFACIFHTFKIMGKVQSYEDLISLFDLNKKVGLKGLKYVNIHTSKDSSIHTTYITPVNLVENLMDKFSATSAQKQEVIALYNQIKNKSSKINRSRPQSVSAGLIWFWICSKGMEITLKEFAVKTGLSELTINKIAKEIAEILKVPYLH
jgi:transcription initiation factor TFIIIB Brf1 subunit/transcription initiation factor TFIIB